MEFLIGKTLRTSLFNLGLDQVVSKALKSKGKNIDNIYKFVDTHFNFSPSNIIKELHLLEPVYKHTACYGHFGREQFPWERVIELKI